MLNNILNLKGITMLKKAEQRTISAGRGGQTCRVSIRLTSGRGQSVLMEGFADGAAGSAEANDYCVRLLASDSSISSCGYDCAHDGFGQ